MNNTLKQLTAFLLVVLVAASCRKEEKLGDTSNIPGLGGDTWAKGPIDSFIHDSLTLPYNIDVKYKWNQFTVAQIEKNVVPCKEEVVIPVLKSALLHVWAGPYIAETNELFLKQYAPKYFVLAGSAAYNRDGSALLGVAGGGRQITLFQLNYFRPRGVEGHTDQDTIVQKESYLTIHHEFSHIFDQTRQRPDEFNNVSQSSYSTDWINLYDDEAREKGFITAYASSQAGEDWAEMISYMLVNGEAGFAEIVNNISSTEAQDAIWQKREIIIKYFKDFWNIDFISLQTRVRAAVENEF
ncbi:MAG: putative zinc-binding metallopeptidase [Ferruginibacter sp.]